jgi:anti-sigma-K factor RskA
MGSERSFQRIEWYDGYGDVDPQPASSRGSGVLYRTLVGPFGGQPTGAPTGILFG